MQRLVLKVISLRRLLRASVEDARQVRVAAGERYVVAPDSPGVSRKSRELEPNKPTQSDSPVTLPVAAGNALLMMSRSHNKREGRLMAACVSFSRAFQDNMAGLHLPVPTILFATLQTSLASTSAALGALKALGPGATVAELIGATTGLELLTVAGSMLGVFYLGAVVGSLMVATNA